MRFHVYVPEYGVQGPTFESDNLNRDRQTILDNFFDWLKGGDGMKHWAAINTVEINEEKSGVVVHEERDADGEPVVQIREGSGYVSVSAERLRREIREEGIRETPRSDLTIAELKFIKSRRLRGARWFE